MAAQQVAVAGYGCLPPTTPQHNSTGVGGASSAGVVGTVGQQGAGAAHNLGSAAAVNGAQFAGSNQAQFPGYVRTTFWTLYMIFYSVVFVNYSIIVKANQICKLYKNSNNCEHLKSVPSNISTLSSINCSNNLPVKFFNHKLRLPQSRKARIL